MESGGLAEKLLRRLGPAAVQLSGIDVERQLAAYLAEAQASFPQLELGPDEFIDHLASHVANSRSLARALAELHGAELFLACACARGVPGAIEELELRYAPAWEGTLRRLDPSPAFADDARQLLREKLFVARQGRSPGIATYSGAGPLGGWLLVTVRRVALNLRRRAPTAPENPSDELAGLGSPVADPELDHLRRTYRPEFDRAFRDALDTLSPRERNLLRLHYLDGVSGQRLSGMYRVHASTISRTLSAARLKLHEETRQRLTERLGLTTSQVASLVGLVLSRLELNLASALGRRR
jgi:RNA polymerase sigma-70 factor (ECF subfamily)